MTDGENDTGFAPVDSLATHEVHERGALTIDAVAKMFKVSPWRLRYYEWRGFIRRMRRGRASVYSWIDCERIALITKARKTGLSLRHIKPVIRAMDAGVQPQESETARERCAALIRLLETQQRAFADALGELRRIDRELREQNRLRLF